jgi:MYXO-CTERM domain-containing protein
MIKRLILLAIPALLFGVSCVQADTYTYTYSGAGVSGILDLQVTPIGGGIDQIIGATGTATISNSLVAAPITFIPGGPGQTTSPSGFFYYDNLLNVGNPSVPFDNNGLLFSVSGTEINLFSGNYGALLPIAEYENNGFNTPIVGTLSPSLSHGGDGALAPEPSLDAALGVGLLGLVAAFRRRRSA